MRNYILVLILILVLFYQLNQNVGKAFPSGESLEGFDEQVSYERQQRSGPLTSYDIKRTQLIESEFPTIPNYFLPFKRF